MIGFSFSHALKSQLPHTLLGIRSIGSEKCAQTILHKLFEWGPEHPGKIPGHPRFLPSKSKEDKLSREGTNFSATTPSRGRPPPHWAVSGPKKLIFVPFFGKKSVLGMRPFCLQLEASCLQLSFFAYNCIFEFFLLTVQAFLLTVGALSSKHLSSSVSKKLNCKRNKTRTDNCK